MNMHTQVEAEEASALITVPAPETAMDVFKSVAGIEPYLKIVRDAVANFIPPDIQTAKGRKEIKSFAMKVTRSKTALEEVGKKLAAETKDLPKKIDATRKHMRDVLDALADDVRKPVDDYETAEQARIEKHGNAIGNITGYATDLVHQSASALKMHLNAVSKIVVGPECEEFADDYKGAIERTTATLTAAISAAEIREAQEAELIELRAKAAAQAAKDREAEIERLAAERAKAEAERLAALEVQRIEAQARADREAAEREKQKAADDAARAVEEAARKEREAVAAIEEANRKAAQAEADARAKIEQERQAEAAATAKREANTKHKAAINRAACAALVAGGLSEDAAKQAVTLIAQGMIPAVTISY